MRFPKSVIDDILQHAQVAHPEECVGLVGGVRTWYWTPNGPQEERVEPKYAYRCRNAASHPARDFMADLTDQQGVMRDMRDKYWRLVAIYHSHTEKPPYPSESDVMFAFFPECLYLITDGSVVKAYWIVDGAVKEEPVECD